MTDAVFALQLIVSNTGSTGIIPSIAILSGLSPDSLIVIVFNVAPVPPFVNVNIASTAAPATPSLIDDVFGFSIWSRS